MKRPEINNRLKTNLLTALSVIGVVGTSVLTAKATIKAVDKIRTEEEKKNEYSREDAIRDTWKFYITPTLAGASTIFCIVSTNVLNRKYQRSLLSAYALISSTYADYKNQVKRKYGEEAHQEILNDICIEKTKDVSISAPNIVKNSSLSLDDVESEKLLFYDMFSKRYFETSYERVLQAEYHLNRNFTLMGDVSVNMFYDFLGLEQVDSGDDIGWSMSDGEILWIDFDHYKATMDDGLEYYIIEFVFSPISLEHFD